ncbi:MAG TPA: sugar transferase [Caulobacteraceae bacterium]|nr:sugar transferase [Caulobacteraceae bacterium]
MSTLEAPQRFDGTARRAARSPATVEDAWPQDGGPDGAWPDDAWPPDAWARRSWAKVARPALEPWRPEVRAAETLRLGAGRIGASRLKRLVDVAGALVGLTLLAPLLALIALMIVLESPGPPLFRQWRTGRGGVPFRIYKFRTLRNADADGEVAQVCRDDPRVSRLGLFLRQSCFDELPQLLNVLKGEMSLVGPRPHALAHDSYYGARIADYRSRFLVRPGISGLAQVCGFRGRTATIEAMAGRIGLDLDYIGAWSFSLDLRILVRTAFEGPFHPAAY